MQAYKISFVHAENMQFAEAPQPELLYKNHISVLLDGKTGVAARIKTTIALIVQPNIMGGHRRPFRKVSPTSTLLAS
jgi:hypothetical protein